MSATEADLQGTSARPASGESGYNEFGMRVWTAEELQFVRTLGERTTPFSVSAARQG
jgi:hypothetical protein